MEKLTAATFQFHINVYNYKEINHTGSLSVKEDTSNSKVKETPKQSTSSPSKGCNCIHQHSTPNQKQSKQEDGTSSSLHSEKHNIHTSPQLKHIYHYRNAPASVQKILVRQTHVPVVLQTQPPIHLVFKMQRRNPKRLMHGLHGNRRISRQRRTEL